MIGAAISRNSIMLGLFAVGTTAVVTGIFLNTNDQIADNIRHAEEKALLEIVPKSRHNNSMLDESPLIDEQTLLGLREPKKMYIARQDGRPVAVILPVTARDGYTGDIDLIVGINIDGSIAGMRVISHRETPGLGDKIDRNKSAWVDHFIGKSLHNPRAEKWKVKKDQGEFDQFTGATITPRAIVNSIHQALRYFEAEKTEIFPELTTTTPSKRKTATKRDDQHALDGSLEPWPVP